MPEIVYAWLAIAVGIAGLVWSADRFVAGSAAIAANAGISKLIIGLTIVSLGTSAPEILVSINASLAGQGDLAIGNALGSNIANIGLVLAVTALIAAIPIRRHILTQEIPVLLFITVIAGIFLFDGHLARWEGWSLLLLIPVLIFLMFTYKKKHPEEIEDEEDIPNLTTTAASFWFVIGLGTLIISSKILVGGAQDIAIYFGVSPLIIGLTVVALGTSLPELAASIMSALKGHHDIALGNIIGSNIFNILAVMSIPGIFGMEALGEEVFERDYAVMAGITLLLCSAIGIDYYFKRKRGIGHLGKLIGICLLTCYFSYYALLFITQDF
ncbi:MAG: calcium/sodium antiporter [Cellvibrionaceae bacterium]